MEKIEDMIKALPPALAREVYDFVQSLLRRHGTERGKKLRQDWAGALSEYRDRYTSLELQRKALEWRGD